MSLSPLKSVRSLLLPFVISDIGNKLVERLQQLCGVKSVTNKNIYFYMIFRLASGIGEEIFSLMPTLFWFGFPAIALPFSTNFGLILMTGQVLKDILCLPRPDIKTSKIIRLESHFETEYGMPSTHSMSGVMPLAALLAIRRHYPNITIPSGLHISFKVLVIAVALSRLYLGVHSVADVAMGLLIGSAGLVVLNAHGDGIDTFVYKSQHGIIVPLLAMYWFCCHYPKARPWSASWGTACQILGTWFGIAVSCWAIFNVPQLQWIAARLIKSSLRPFWTEIFYKELAVGAIISGAAKLSGKIFAQKVAVYLLDKGISGPHPEERVDFLGRAVPITKLYCVEVPTRLFSYAFTSFCVVIVTPVAWAWVGLRG